MLKERRRELTDREINGIKNVSGYPEFKPKTHEQLLKLYPPSGQTTLDSAMHDSQARNHS